VSWHRELLFGEIVNAEMRLSRYGEIVQKWWNEIPSHFPNVETGAFVVMPNHVHGNIFILERRGAVPAPDDVPSQNKIKAPQNMDTEELNRYINSDDIVQQGGETPPLQTSTVFQGTPTLGQIIAYFKYQSSKEMNEVEDTGTVTKFWQRNYYEHILRDETDLQNKTNYIKANPLLWDEDDENPINLKK